jgi:hypothetical protein
MLSSIFNHRQRNIRRGPTKTSSQSLWQLILAFIVLLSLVLLTLLLPWIKKTLPHQQNDAAVLIMVGALVVAALLYLLRKYCRASYGLVELSIGIILVYTTVDNAPPVIDDTMVNLIVVQIAAGIYIIIRSFDNLAQSGFFGVDPASPGARLISLFTRRRKKQLPDPD